MDTIVYTVMVLRYKLTAPSSSLLSKTIQHPYPGTKPIFILVLSAPLDYSPLDHISDGFPGDYLIPGFISS